jgi:hypothetical protein
MPESTLSFLDRTQHTLNVGLSLALSFTACGLLLPQIITLFMLTRPDIWRVSSSLNKILAVNMLFILQVLKQR